jgi:deoxyribose-phosphate aldolase
MPGMDHILSKGYLLTGGVAFSRWQLVKAVAGSVTVPAQCARMVSATDAGVIPLGVCMEDVDLTKVQTGKAIAQIATQGNVKCIWDGVGAAPTPGAVVKLSAATAGTKDGQVTVATKAAGGVAPAAAVGIVLDILGNSIGAAAAAGDWFDVELVPGMMF